jgi:hypothetical protein
MHFHPIGLLVFTQPEVQSHVVAGKKIPSGPDPVELSKPSRSHLHQCSNPISIALGSDRLHLQPMSRRLSTVIS